MILFHYLSGLTVIPGPSVNCFSQPGTLPHATFAIKKKRRRRGKKGHILSPKTYM